MTGRFCRIFMLGAIVLLIGCDNTPKEHHHSILNFGTLIDITLYDVEPAMAERAFKELDNDFQYFHDAWTPWEPSSVSRINTLIPTGKAFSVGPSVLPLIIESRRLSEASNGLYNPAIGKLIRLWQFHKHDDPDLQPPSDVAIQQLVKQNPRLSDLQLKGIRMSSDNPAIELNFGAYAKGYAIDLSMQRLRELGIYNAIINTGGDLKAIGRHGERPWKIAIRHPRQDGIIASIETRDNEAIFTSGDYERYYIHQGKRYHHILDPRTGYPAQGTQSVTVIHPNSGHADAAATALFIAGPNGWYNIAKQLGLIYVMLIDNQGRIHLSPEMKRRIQLNNVNESALVVSLPLS